MHVRASRVWRVRAWLWAGCCLAGCGGEEVATPPPDGAIGDVGLGEGSLDAGAPDEGASDSEMPDSEMPDSDVLDGEIPDSEIPDIEWPEIEEIALGPCAPGEPISFELPEGFESALIQAQGAAAGLYQIVTLDGPGGDLIAEGRATPSPQPAVATALAPSDGAGRPLEPGRYTFSVEPLGPHEGALTCSVWLRGAGPGRLHVNVLVPPEAQIERGQVEIMVEALTERLRAEMALDAISAEIYSLPPGSPVEVDIGPSGAEISALGELAAAGAALALPVGLDVYLLDQISAGPITQAGISGGLPAPIGVGGPASVVAVRASLLDDFPTEVAWQVAHELGHALGLYHTTEGPLILGRTPHHDPIADTAECPAICDVDRDGVLYGRECGIRGEGVLPCQGTADNLMFWSPVGLKILTDGQRAAVHRHPLVGWSPQ